MIGYQLQERTSQRNGCFDCLGIVMRWSFTGKGWWSESKSRDVEVLEATPLAPSRDSLRKRYEVPYGDLQSLPHTGSGTPATSKRQYLSPSKSSMKAWPVPVFTEPKRYSYSVRYSCIHDQEPWSKRKGHWSRP